MIQVHFFVYKSAWEIVSKKKTSERRRSHQLCFQSNALPPALSKFGKSIASPSFYLLFVSHVIMSHSTLFPLNYFVRLALCGPRPLPVGASLFFYWEPHHLHPRLGSPVHKNWIPNIIGTKKKKGRFLLAPGNSSSPHLSDICGSRHFVRPSVDS